MKDEVAITTTLTRRQTIALLQNLRMQYSLDLNEHWYDDRFRLIPVESRHQSLLKAFPALAAQKCLIGAIKESLS